MAIQIGGIGQNNIIDNLRENTAIGAQTGSNPTQAAAATEIQSAQNSGSSTQPSGNAQSQAANNLISKPKGSWSKRTQTDDDAGDTPAEPQEEIVEATPESSGLELRQTNIPGGSTTRVDPVSTYIDVNTGEPKQPLVSELIGKGIQAGADAVQTAGENVKLAGRIAFTDPASGKLVNRPLIESVPAWKEAGVSYAEQAEAFGTVAGIAALPLGATTQVGGKVISAVAQTAPKVAGAAGRTIGGLFGFGSLASIGGETEVSKMTSKWSESIQQTSSQIIGGAQTPGGKIAATLAAVPLGAAGGLIEGAGAIPSAFIGAGKLASSVLNPAGAVNTFLEGTGSSVRGFMQWIDDSKANPAYAVGETIGFSGAYKGATGGISKGLQLTGKYTGVIDTNIVDTGNLVISQNPLLSAAISSGAAEPGGFVRIDTAPKVSAQGTDIRVLENIGSRVTVKTPGGKELLSFGRSNPLTSEGEIDLQRSQSEYPLYASQEGVPFIYGAPTFKGAGTVEGFLDKTPAYLSTKVTREAAAAVLPIPTSQRAGRVLSYDSSNPVTVSGRETTSDAPYTPGQFSEFYSFGKLQEIDTGKFRETLAGRQGITPVPTPKQAAGGDKSYGNLWLSQSERELAYTTRDLSNPQFRRTSFGGFTASGIPITKLGSDNTIVQNFQNNLMRNIRTVRNPAVRRTSGKTSEDRSLTGFAPTNFSLKNAPRDFVEMYGRDVAFRVAELVGKPSGRVDITEHGATHVENVARLASSLKRYQGSRYQKVSEDEIYFAGILHDAAKNTAYESVPGGHGEMVGSVLRSGVSLDARSYLRPEARKEFESILGTQGTERLNRFLDRWEKLTPKQQRNVANAISQHTTNLKGGPLAQTQRLTANKLGRLISDADRIELRRYADNPADFKPKAWKMFASQDVVRQATMDVYGMPQQTRSAGFRDTVQSLRGATRSQTKARESGYSGYTYSTGGRAYGFARPPAQPSMAYGYDVMDAASRRAYNPATASAGSSYPGTGSGYKGIGYSGGSRTFSSAYSVNPPKDVLFQEVRRKRDDDEKGKEATYNRIRIGTRRHLGIADPLEFLGEGSITKRSKRSTPERVRLQDELSWRKRPVYEFDGGYSGRKPKNRTRRR